MDELNYFPPLNKVLCITVSSLTSYTEKKSSCSRINNINIYDHLISAVIKSVMMAALERSKGAVPFLRIITVPKTENRTKPCVAPSTSKTKPAFI